MAKKLIDIGTSANKGDGDALRTAFSKINDNFNELYASTALDPGAIGASFVPDTDATYDLGGLANRWADLHVADFIYLNGARIEVTAGGALLVNGGAPAEVQDTVGSVFGDDSTLLVDGVNSIIPSANISGTEATNWDTAFSWGDHSAAGYLTDLTGDLKGSVFADDSTVLVDSVAGKIVGDVENNSVITGRVKSQDDIDLYVFAGGTGAVILAGQSDLSIGHTIGQTDIYGDVEFNNGTTAFQSGNDVEFNCPVDFTNATITMPQYISLADLKTEVAAATDFLDFQARIAAL